MVEVDSKGDELVKTSKSSSESTLAASAIEATELRKEVSKIEKQLIDMQKQMEEMIKTRKKLLVRIDSLNSGQ